MKKQEKPFSERHPRLNLLLGIIMLVAIIAIAILLIKFIFQLLGVGIVAMGGFLKKIVSTTDKVIIVAMITGSVSILGVVISSIIAKIVDYRFNVKKYLYDKREVPYEQFIDMVYRIMEDVNKPENDRMPESEMQKMVSEFSKGLTLWGSNRVAKKWIKYRKQCQDGSAQNLFLLEEIIYEMRRDVGLRRKMKKGNILSFFINDIEIVLKK